MEKQNNDTQANNEQSNNAKTSNENANQTEQKPEAKTDVPEKEPVSQNEPAASDSQENKPQFELIYNNQNSSGEFPLEEGKEITIGANPKCEGYVEDDYISSSHFSVCLKGKSIEVKDLNSKNGLFLKIDKPKKIKPGQSLLLAGKTTFKVQEKKA